MAIPKLTIIYSIAVLLLSGCTPMTAPLDPPMTAKPKLTLVIVVDQMRYDYFTRFADDFVAGLKLLQTRSAFFTQAHHLHAPTTTAPGHATLVSCRYPRDSGIVDNQWYDRQLDKTIPAVYDPVFGVSPQNMLVSSFGDWLKQSEPLSRVYAVAGKDRSAILLAGKQADGAFWYNKKNGGFGSSSYYGNGELPQWLTSFNQEKIADSYFASLWRALPVTPEHLAKRGVLNLDQGLFADSFPHEIGAPTVYPNSSFYEALYSTPFLDELTVAAAKKLIHAEKLGKGAASDYLGLSFSALDTIGHRYGPQSAEVYDTVRRLDLTLGDLFGYIDSEIGLANVVIALSADHGVIPFPEGQSELQPPAHRLDYQDIQCQQKIWKKIQDTFGLGTWFQSNGYLNYELAEKSKVDPQKIATLVTKEMASCPAIAAAWSQQQLQQPPSSTNPLLAAYQRGYYAGRSPDLILLPQENLLTVRRIGTTHSTPYKYDTHVPFLFVKKGINAQQLNSAVSTVDFAQTLATLVGISPPHNCSGRSRL